jgi:hypothetical protein
MQGMQHRHPSYSEGLRGSDEVSQGQCNGSVIAAHMTPPTDPGLMKLLLTPSSSPAAREGPRVGAFFRPADQVPGPRSFFLNTSVRGVIRW